ncbi:LytR/AlgR family response regulator transcription factor [Aurantibacillus circumpalustris]|uniref:LytR/AlgR family response regulator transcription factor n=1 Tax=Aurantibacillus circumpalustris TaxID=3036359 RepID=UPI00295BCB95|nr:LytTR family DNA-binding domain-containing protein [Aurantibacillus circumpalustris]
MLSAILVDDEEKSLKNLTILLNEYCNNVEIINTASNALQAVKLILSNKPDLVFLDVQMPGYNGFDVLEQIGEVSSTVIFTTAHKEYAINALRKGAFDYLLKPIDGDDLKNCILRATEKISKEKNLDLSPNANKGIIELSVKDGIIFIRQEKIVRLEASGSYTVFFMDNDIKHLVSKSMKEYEALLDPTVFFRCHNSHIINLKMVAKFNNNNGYFAELTNGSVVEIARRSKDLFLQRLKNI